MQAMRAAFDRVRTEGTVYELELETVQGEDGTRWIRDRAEAVRDVTGRITGVRGISQDITAIKDLQQLREEWLSVIAHDLRQPIGAIKMAAQLLPDLHVGKMTEGEAAITARVGSAAQSLARMVDDLLDASRLETKRLALERSWVKPHDIVADAIARVAHLTTGCTVKVAEQETPPQVFADPVRFTQVLGNLISNAAKYGEKNGEIEVRVTGGDSELHVTVTNRGKGIAPDEARRLFSRFARLAGAHKSSVKGMGLGLYIAKGLVEAHGGRMWVESVPNETTAFHFTLPVEGSGKAAA
jgi:signal transduction histidine kinase